MGYRISIQYYGLKGKWGKVQEDLVHITMIQIQKEVFKKIEIKIYSDSGGGIQEHQKFRFIYCDSDSEESIQGGRNSDLSSVTVI